MRPLLPIRAVYLSPRCSLERTANSQVVSSPILASRQQAVPHQDQDLPRPRTRGSQPGGFATTRRTRPFCFCAAARAVPSRGSHQEIPYSQAVAALPQQKATPQLWWANTEVSENRPEDKTVCLSSEEEGECGATAACRGERGVEGRVCVCDSQVREHEHRVGGRASQRFELDLCRLHQPHAVLVKDLVTCFVFVCSMRDST